MKLIDFDKHFERYLKNWMEENRSKYKTMDDMEAQMPEVYTRWLNEPAPWLDGDAPGFYFDRFADADALVQMMAAYMEEGVSVPDQLLERITALGEQAAPPLLALAGGEGISQEARMTAVGLLREIDSAEPMELYLSWLKKAQKADELIENAVESLKNMGGRILEPCLQIEKEASLPIRECIADILTDYPLDERIFHMLMELFKASPRKALVASFLGKYGDERALPALEKALGDVSINYLDYIEISNAILGLGGEVAIEREFAGDPYYESMKQI